MYFYFPDPLFTPAASSLGPEGRDGDGGQPDHGSAPAAGAPAPAIANVLRSAALRPMDGLHGFPYGFAKGDWGMHPEGGVWKHGAAAPKRATAPEAETARESSAAKPGLRKVQAGPHIEIHARDMRLDDVARERLARIAARYFKATHRKLVLTGGTRVIATYARELQRRGQAMVARPSQPSKQ